MAIAGQYNDEPTLDDLIGRTRLVKTIGDEIAGCRAPQVFGIHGDWGSGKTSFLHMLHWYLTGECPESPTWTKDKKPQDIADWTHWKKNKDVRVVWFEAWRYQYETNPIVALLQEIRTQLQGTLKGVWNETKKLSEVAVYGALFSMESLTNFLRVSPSKIQEAGEKWEKDHYATQLPTHVIRGLLQQLIGQLLGKKNRKLVVLIDDLDRCEGECVYRLLEGIKIYLSIPNCVFVLGMDQQIVELAVGKHINTGSPGDQRLLAREYVEKICRNIWYLPLMSDSADLLKRILDKIPVAQKICDVIRAYNCLPANPRKVKAFAHVVERFINHFEYRIPFTPPPEFGKLPTTFKKVSKDDKIPVVELESVAGLIVIMASLYMFHPEIYRIIEAHPLFYQQVLDWAAGNESNDNRLKEIQRISERSENANKLATPNAEPPTPIFTDPMRGFIFRVQGLVRDLGDNVTDDVIRRCLLGTRV